LLFDSRASFAIRARKFRADLPILRGSAKSRALSDKFRAKLHGLTKECALGCKPAPPLRGSLMRSNQMPDNRHGFRELFFAPVPTRGRP
jgi:hypothetical protein